MSTPTEKPKVLGLGQDGRVTVLGSPSPHGVRRVALEIDQGDGTVAGVVLWRHEALKLALMLNRAARGEP